MMLSDEFDSALAAEIERLIQRRLKDERESGEYWGHVEREVKSQLDQTTVYFNAEDTDNPHITVMGGDGDLIVARKIPLREILDYAFDPAEEKERLAIAQAMEKCAMQLRQGEWK